MNVFVFEFEESFNLACLPQNMEVKCPFGLFHLVNTPNGHLTSIFCGKPLFKLSGMICLVSLVVLKVAG